MPATYVLLSLVTPLLYCLLTTAAYYLMARALVTQWLWSRYPPALDRFFWCAACSGFWYGLAVAFAIGWWRDLPFLGLPGRFWLTPIAVGLGSIVWTPLLAKKHVEALLYLGESDKVEPGAEADTGIEAAPQA
jgi:hypothetical protein